MAEESERILLGVVKILLVVGAEQRGQIEQLQKQAQLEANTIQDAMSLEEAVAYALEETREA